MAGQVTHAVYIPLRPVTYEVAQAIVCEPYAPGGIARSPDEVSCPRCIAILVERGARR